VKLEDAMQPRYGKNYCIVPQLDGGPTKIEILFQQNLFPPQQFNILIPENGSRGFLLVKRDSGFALYDLQQSFYLPAGNDVSEDHLPTTAAPVASTEPQQPATETVPDRVPEERTVPKKIVKKEKPPKAVKPKAKSPAKVVVTSNDPQFIPGMELGKNNETANNTVKTTIQPKPAAITNSDCPSAISAADFKPIFNEMSAQNGDEDRLSYVLGKLDKCYESWQARAMAQMLSEDAARFTLFKKIYPRISDQGSFPLLDDLLTSPTWKAEFARLVHH
jgi:hypothetical protein